MRSNISANDIEFKVGDLVCYRNHHKRSKLNMKWRPYYVVIKRNGPVSCKINDQLTSLVIQAHTEHLKVVNIKEWIIPTDNRLP